MAGTEEGSAPADVRVSHMFTGTVHIAVLMGDTRTFVYEQTGGDSFGKEEDKTE